MIQPMQERKYVRIFLLVPSLVVLFFVCQIFRPFLLPISLAMVLSTICFPIFRWLSAHLRNRSSLAALLTCLLVTAIIIVPVVVLTILLAGEVSQVYQKFQESLARGDFNRLFRLKDSAILGPLFNWINQYVATEQIDIMGGVASALQQVSLFFLKHSTELLTKFVSLVTDFFIMLVTMFFLFRDGPRLLREVRSWTPLSSQYEDLILKKFREVTSATVLGSLLTAVAQGLASGIVYWILGVPNALFWGTLTAFFSLVPVVGTALVWVPLTLYLVSIGSLGRAIALALLASLLVGSIDNIIRPMFIEGRAKLHSLLVFFAIMGGIGYFGMVGMVFGPIVIALGLTFLELYKTEFRDELTKADSP